jgi:predicted transcriptional regulator
MPTITVKLSEEQATRLTRLARVHKITKSEMVRHLIDVETQIRTVDDPIEWAEASNGKGLGLAQQ